MNMDFGPWFYNYYRYLKGNRDGKESFNSTRFIDTMERFQKVKDLFNLQPYGIVGNTSGFEKLIDLMTRSNYTFEDINDVGMFCFEFDRAMRIDTPFCPNIYEEKSTRV